MKNFIILSITLLMFACSGQPSTTEIKTIEEKSTVQSESEAKKNPILGEWVIIGVKENGKAVDLHDEKTSITLNEDGRGISSNKNASIKWSLKEEAGKKTLILKEEKDDEESFEVLSLDEKKLVLKAKNAELTLEKK
jgi:hypothetical protein